MGLLGEEVGLEKHTNPSKKIKKNMCLSSYSVETKHLALVFFQEPCSGDVDQGVARNGETLPKSHGSYSSR